MAATTTVQYETEHPRTRINETETLGAQAMPMFTCITCRVAFVDADLQRAHYKTEWHRYNLKRRVAELPPVSSEHFQERVIAQQELEADRLEGKIGQYCQVCRKHFATAKSFESHLRSRKHKGVARALEKQKIKETTSTEKREPANKESSGSDAEEEEIEEEPASEPLDATECLFCPHGSHDLETNMEHMSKDHGFFIPDLEYLTDLAGLMSYLAEKVGVWNMCLHCNEKGRMFHSVEAVQHHMVDKGHCKLFFEGDASLEYAEFYDYSKSYPDYSEDGDFNKDKEVSPEDNSLQVLNSLCMCAQQGWFFCSASSCM